MTELMALANPEVSCRDGEPAKATLEHLLGARLQDDELPLAAEVCASALRTQYPQLRLPQEVSSDEAAIRSWLETNGWATLRVPPLSPELRNPRGRWTADAVRNLMS
ncbi:hypothetical protein [Amycolatopsis sp. WGS_07]|uniref:hypothetical protein n=1 Tax=Amycolatopsis sp. WGS_07 TaxID=3076764 RepID=UPI0038732ED5